MKIVGYDEFCRMPAGTVFAPYEPCVLHERLAIKVDGGWMGSDGRYYFNGVITLEPDLIDDQCNIMMCEIGDELPAEFTAYDGDSNDYAKYDKFLVFGHKDTEQLIRTLCWARYGCVCSVEDWDAYAMLNLEEE